MEKKKKKQSSVKQIKNRQTSNPLRQQEEAVRRAANQRYYGGVDYNSDRMKRRISATAVILEEFKAGLLGAAIWILDIIRDRGDIRAVAELLPDHVNPTEADMPDVWAPCHSEEMLLGILSILQNRNADCTGIKNPEKNRVAKEPILLWQLYCRESA